jgi:hypothetical protein
MTYESNIHPLTKSGGTHMKKVRLLTQATAMLPVAAAATMATATAPAAAATARPDVVTQQACSPTANKNWIHLDTTYHGLQCFGGTGSVYPDYFAALICPGNNLIDFQWRSPYGDYYGHSLTPGAGWYSMGNSRDYVSFIYNNGWSGQGTC